MGSLQINMTLNLIQQIRLIHALTEPDFDIGIPDSEEPKFDAIKEYFRI